MKDCKMMAINLITNYGKECYQQGRTDGIDEFVEWLNKHHNYGACAIDMYVKEYREVLKEQNVKYCDVIEVKGKNENTKIQRFNENH